MAIHVNLTGVTTVFPVLPQGYYQAMVAGCEQKLSKPNADGKRTQMLKWTFHITEPEEFLGSKVWHNTMLEGGGRFATKLVLIALGMGTEESLTGDIAFEVEEVLGEPCTLVIVPDEYEGKEQSKIKAVLEAGVEE